MSTYDISKREKDKVNSIDVLHLQRSAVGSVIQEQKFVLYLSIHLTHCRGFEKPRQLRILTTRERPDSITWKDFPNDETLDAENATALKNKS